jgi:hypothetical protein
MQNNVFAYHIWYFEHLFTDSTENEGKSLSLFLFPNSTIW